MQEIKKKIITDGQSFSSPQEDTFSTSVSTSSVIYIPTEEETIKDEKASVTEEVVSARETKNIEPEESHGIYIPDNKPQKSEDAPEVALIKKESNEVYSAIVELKITNPDEFSNAVTLSGRISGLKDRISAYYAPKKKEAHDAHKAICAEEKEILKVPTNAETVLNKAIAQYLDEAKKRDEQQQAVFKKEMEDQIKKYLDDAAVLEKEKKFVESEELIRQAAMCEKAMKSVVLKTDDKVSESIKTSVEYVITIEDANLVPVSFAGEVIRPVDESAIKRLIKKSNGTIQIPGVKYVANNKIKVKAN